MGVLVMAEEVEEVGGAAGSSSLTTRQSANVTVKTPPTSSTYRLPIYAYVRTYDNYA